MYSKFHFHIIWIIISFISANSVSNIRTDALLFCLDEKIETLKINQSKSATDNELINSILKNYDVKSIDKWLLHARPKEHDKNIYLNRIFRITLDKFNISILSKLKNELNALSIIHSVENEYYRKPTFTPNDSQYNQQWFLPQINADDAWNLWDINSDEIINIVDVII